MNALLDIVFTLFALIYYSAESVIMFLTPTSWKKKDVKDDLVLVTGAGSGIGRLVANRFAKLGCTVVLWDVDKQGNKETEKMITDDGGKAFSYTVDLSVKDDIYKVAERVKKEIGKITILVNNAGIVTGKSILEAPDHMIQSTFAVNILAHFWTVKAFLPDMIAMDRGHIVTVASLAGMVGCNGLTDYCSSKFAAVGFDEAMRMELRVGGRKNINTTIVCPYFTDTGMFDGVTSRIIPVLTPQVVANEIMDGILTNSKMVIIPRYCFMIIVLKLFIPMKIYDFLTDKTGLSAEWHRGRPTAERLNNVED